MAYSDFTLGTVESAFGLTTEFAELFPDLERQPVPGWLGDMLARGRQTAALVSEKARSEFLVVPILLATREFARGNLAIFSGQNLDVDPARGLVGPCDFLLARTSPVPRLKAPLIAVVEAKKGDIDAGLGQCVAQMVAARIFNERAGEPARPIFGCVTTGDEWQFLRLEGPDVALDRDRLFINDVGDILATLRAILEQTA